MYGSPQASSSAAVKDLKRKEAESLHQQQQQQRHQMGGGGGLLRYQSAPSTLFGDVCEDFLQAVPPPRASNPDAENEFAGFFGRPDLCDKPPSSASLQYSPAPAAMEDVAGHHHQQQQQQLLYHHSQQHAHVPGHGSVGSLYRTAAAADQTKGAAFSTATRAGGAANLVRHSSSPAGLFSHLNVENGYGMMRGIGGAGGGSVADSSGNRLKGQQSFSSRQNSLMSQISEMGSEGMDGSSPDASGGAGGGRCYFPGYPITLWEEPSLLSDDKMVAGMNPSEAPQNGEASGRGLGHQFSLPKSSSSSSEMAAVIDNFLHFQDAVPCKIRAKRGCATHPRSIAERVRRTRISERIRKLQELVPNMDKQTSTADMLDFAVDHIKELQKQAKVLAESRANCTCSSSSKQKHG